MEGRAVLFIVEQAETRFSFLLNCCSDLRDVPRIRLLVASSFVGLVWPTAVFIVVIRRRVDFFFVFPAVFVICQSRQKEIMHRDPVGPPTPQHVFGQSN